MSTTNTDTLADLKAAERIVRDYDCEGFDAVIGRLKIFTKVTMSKPKGIWHGLTVAGVKAISVDPGLPLLHNWAAAARRELARG